MLSLTLASLLALVQTSIAQTSTSAAPTATSTVAFNMAAKAAGKLYSGSATDNPELTDITYVTILNDTAMFGQLTPANSMKWDAIESEQNVFNFTGGDQIVALAEATGKIMRGHNLVWYSQLPDRVTYGNWTPDTLTSVIETHVRTEISHYAGKICKLSPSVRCNVPFEDAWDVVNEPLNDNGTMRTDVFYNTLNTSYINIALQTAHAADRINEYNFEYTGPKIDAMVQLVEDLLAAGAPIQWYWFRFEGHFILGEISPSELQTNITALGLEVAVTELDDRQKADCMSVVQTCMAVSGCIGITVWDYTDKYSWIPSTFAGYGEACPWDANLVREPAYDGIAMGFMNYIA